MPTIISAGWHVLAFVTIVSVGLALTAFLPRLPTVPYRRRR